MRVINLLGHDFNRACQSLSFKIKETYHPDIVIGILTGGGYIGREICKYLDNLDDGVIYTEVKLQRGSTKAKEVSHLKNILRLLPQKVLDFLRILEVEFLEIKAKIVKPNRYGTIILPENIIFQLAQGKRKILLVDDCIDTGYTLKIIKEYIENKYPNNIIKIAVITTAHRYPVINADFQLYKKVLIRFPWAYDTKKKSSCC